VPLSTLPPRRQPNRSAKNDASPSLSDAVYAWAKFFAAEGRRWLVAQLKTCRQCRECGSAAKLTDDVCGSCGASSPVKVPRTVPAAIGTCAVLLLLVVWCCT
jgi:hypothetical protein